MLRWFGGLNAMGAVTMANKHTHYWFAPPGDKLGYGDGRIAKVGETHTVEGPLKPCESGLHMSKRPIDALIYARTPILYGVSPGEDIIADTIEDTYKGCSNSRTYHWRLDCTDILAEFARWCALEVEHLWDMPDVVQRFLETGNEELRSDASDAAARAAYAAGAARAAEADRAAYAAVAAVAAVTAVAARAARAAEAASASADAYAVAAGAASADMWAKQNAKLEQMIMEKLAEEGSDNG